MKSPKMTYFEAEDVLHLAIADEPERESMELSPNVTAELNAEGEVIGIEILQATGFLRDSIMESVQARLLHPTREQLLGRSGNRTRRRAKTH